MTDRFDFEVMTEDLAFPEGLIACAHGSVLVGEILGRCVTVLPDGSKEPVADIDCGPNGLAIGSNGDIFVCNNGGFEAPRMRVRSLSDASQITVPLSAGTMLWPANGGAP